MKKFNQCSFGEPAYVPVRVEENGKRFYASSVGKFPSITTVLSVVDNDWLEKWKESVGEEAAAAISRKATTIGTGLHSLCEHYLLNETSKVSKMRMSAMPEVKVRFDNFKSFLDKITDVYLLEAPVASSILGIAGTVDCVAVYEGTLYAIDFKTSNKQKHRSDIKSYFAQGSFYSYAIMEQYGLKSPPKVLIAIATNGIKEPSIFIEEPKDHIAYVIEAKAKFNAKVNSDA